MISSGCSFWVLDLGPCQSSAINTCHQFENLNKMKTWAPSNQHHSTDPLRRVPGAQQHNNRRSTITAAALIVLACTVALYWLEVCSNHGVPVCDRPGGKPCAAPTAAPRRTTAERWLKLPTHSISTISWQHAPEDSKPTSPHQAAAPAPGTATPLDSQAASTTPDSSLQRFQACLSSHAHLTPSPTAAEAGAAATPNASRLPTVLVSSVLRDASSFGGSRGVNDYFQLLTSFDYPRCLLSVGILVSDESYFEQVCNAGGRYSMCMPVITCRFRVRPPASAAHACGNIHVYV